MRTSFLFLILAMACTGDGSPGDDLGAEAAKAAVSAADLINRDGLFDSERAFDEDSAYAAYLIGELPVELDGIAPAERVILIGRPVPEASATTTVHAYRLSDGRWTPLGDPLETGGYLEPGYVEVVDLEGNGQQELMLVGDTDGTLAADLSVMRWEETGWRERVWGLDPGIGYAVWDTDKDGKNEVVGLPGADEPGPVGLTVLHLAGDGFLRERPIGDANWLVDLLASTLASGVLPDHRLDGILNALQGMAVPMVPSESRQVNLEKRYDEASEVERISLVSAMALAPSPRVLGFLGEQLSTDQEMPHLSVAAALSRLSKNGRDLVYAEAVRRTKTPITDELVALYRGGLGPFAEAGDSRLRVLFTETVRNPSTGNDLRGELLYWALPADMALAPVLLEVLAAPGDDAEFARMAAMTLARTSTSFDLPRRDAWRAALAPSALRALTDSPHAHIRVQAWVAIHDRTHAELLGAIDREQSPEHRRRLAVMLTAASNEAQAQALVVRLKRELQGEVRNALIGALATSAFSSAWAAGLQEAKTAEDLLRWTWAARRWDPRQLTPSMREEMSAILVAGPVNSADPRIRQHTVALLGLMSTTASRAALLHRMRFDTEHYVRSTATLALGKCAETETELSALAAELDGADPSSPNLDSYLLDAIVITGDARLLARLDEEMHAKPAWFTSIALALRGGGEGSAAILLRHIELPKYSAQGAPSDEACSQLRALVSAAGHNGSQSIRTHFETMVLPQSCEELALGDLIEAWWRLKLTEPLERMATHPDRNVRFEALAALHRNRSESLGEGR